MQTQVKLLRVLQEQQVVPVGATTAVAVDARIIAATNRSLSREVLAGRFRADLFYRLAVAVIKLPALRDRDGDLSLLIDHLMRSIDLEQSFAGDVAQKTLSAEGKNFLLRQSWPGNVREFQNTLTRAAIWSSGSTITLDDVRDAMLDMPAGAQGSRGILQADLGEGFDINRLLSSVARHYLTRAMQQAGGNMSDAAKLLGLGSYKTVGWGFEAQLKIGPGRVNLTGDAMYDAMQALVADYLLRFYGIPLAVLESKAEGEDVADGMQQGSRYASRLNIRFSIATNGHDWILTDNETGAYEVLSAPPTPEDIIARHGVAIDFDRWGRAFAAAFHVDQITRKRVRPYQEIAIAKTLWQFAQGDGRVLLLMATGTGKTFTVFQLVWKLLNGGVLGREHVLFLTDRNSLKDQA